MKYIILYKFILTDFYLKFVLHLDIYIYLLNNLLLFFFVNLFNIYLNIVYLNSTIFNSIFLVNNMPISVIKMDPSKYPIIRRDDTVIDDYHGTKVKDPYRYLEDPDFQETKDFVETCNKITEPFLNNCPVRKEINNKLSELWNFEKFGCYAKHGDYYYHFHNTGLQNQRLVSFI